MSIFVTKNIFKYVNFGLRNIFQDVNFGLKTIFKDDSWTDVYFNRKMIDIQTDRHINTQTDRQIDKYTDRRRRGDHQKDGNRQSQHECEKRV